MQRLTEPDPEREGCQYQPNRSTIGMHPGLLYQDIVDRLGKYEDIGMEPEELATKLSIKRLEKMTEYAGFSVSDLALVHHLVTKAGITPEQLKDIRELTQTIINLVMQEQERAFKSQFDNVMSQLGTSCFNE